MLRDDEAVALGALDVAGVGLSIVRRWIEQEGADAVADLANSGVGLAVNPYLHEKNRTMLASSTATSDLTGKFCQPTTVQWTLDT